MNDILQDLNNAKEALGRKYFQTRINKPLFHETTLAKLDKAMNSIDKAIAVLSAIE